MKNYLKFLAVATVAISIASCGDKKEEKTEVTVKTEETTPVNNEAAAAEQLADLGAELFYGKGTCVTCHKENEKSVGPSIKEIAGIYKEKGASIAAFINEESEAIVDPAQYEVMKANFTITKAMTQEERNALQAYMMDL